MKTVGQPSCVSHQEVVPSSTPEQPSSSPDGSAMQKAASTSSRKETSPSSHEDETPSCSPKEATPDAAVHVVTTSAVHILTTEASSTETKARSTETKADFSTEVKEPVSHPTKPSTSSESSEAQRDKGTGAEMGQQKSSSSEFFSSGCSLMQEPISRSRSATPTPAISIEPDHGLEWTADMLSLPESEVVTSETSLAKARGSNTAGPVYPSDDDSVDGGDVDTPDEGAEGDSEGGGGDNDPTPDSAKQEAKPAPTSSAPSETDNVSCQRCSAVARGPQWGVK